LLAKHGARVIVNDYGGSEAGSGGASAPADDVVAEIRKAGGEAVANYDSVASMAGGKSIVDAAVKAFGRIDIVVNNAGILRDRMIFNMSEEEWDAVIDTHLKGSFAVTRAAAPLMREQKSGRFINMTSTSGLVGNVGQANYAAAKLGIVGLTRVTALDMARYNVTANCISPFAWTRMIGTIPTGTEAQQARVEKIKKMSPAHIAPLAAFLASDRAKDISGQIFGVRGKEIMLYRPPPPDHADPPCGRLDGRAAGGDLPGDSAAPSGAARDIRSVLQLRSFDLVGGLRAPPPPTRAQADGLL
jgi:NAD(P)-dependent dehydrogenase (short-subunit alcohol dehydrogenase family)